MGNLQYLNFILKLIVYHGKTTIFPKNTYDETNFILKTSEFKADR